MKNLLRLLKQYKIQFLAIAILMAVTFLTLALVKREQSIRTKAGEPDTGTLTFSSLTPDSVIPGDSFTVRVDMNNGGQSVEGMDIVVLFDKDKLTLQSIDTHQDVIGTEHEVFKTYAPTNIDGSFDKTQVITKANNPATGGEIEFGVLAYDWNTSSFPTVGVDNSNMYPAARLEFQVKPSATLGSTNITFKNQGILTTTDSNIMVLPVGGDPEDILQTSPYAGDTVVVSVVSIPGDVNGDKKVNISDLSTVGYYFGEHVGPDCDIIPLNHCPNIVTTYVGGEPDGMVNISDLSLVGYYFGTGTEI